MLIVAQKKITRKKPWKFILFFLKKNRNLCNLQVPQLVFYFDSLTFACVYVCFEFNLDL